MDRGLEIVGAAVPPPSHPQRSPPLGGDVAACVMDQGEPSNTAQTTIFVEADDGRGDSPSPVPAQGGPCLFASLPLVRIVDSVLWWKGPVSAMQGSGSSPSLRLAPHPAAPRLCFCLQTPHRIRDICLLGGRLTTPCAAQARPPQSTGGPTRPWPLHHP
jgi:hypothetical protein